MQNRLNALRERERVCVDCNLCSSKKYKQAVTSKEYQTIVNRQKKEIEKIV